ncbi:hypothetical protein [Bacillus phage SDFMU_Pbc]|uniref:Uncharacterized protein n=1 Tax=Bacillus phage SDFMU_Pbc TaxID=3076135 RepID=A0AA96KR82_9CAUD|nr:hypothetical protein [Bacillus phage SDFMU_Pbc]
MAHYDFMRRKVSIEELQGGLEEAQYSLETCKIEDSQILRDVTKRGISEIGAQRLIEYLDGELRQKIKINEQKVRKFERLIRKVNNGEEVRQREVYEG